MEENKEKVEATETKKDDDGIFAWGDLDFSNVAASELGKVINRLNQRLAMLERNVYRHTKDGNLRSDPKTGSPITIEEEYKREALAERDKKFILFFPSLYFQISWGKIKSLIDIFPREITKNF